MLVKEEYLSVAGHRIRFLEKGQGPPLVLLHGLGGSLEWWEYNLDAFAQKYRTIAFDFPGFGLSSKSGSELLENYGEDWAGTCTGINKNVPRVGSLYNSSIPGKYKS